MRRALVLNVGAGDREVDGLIRALQGAIRTTNPDRLAMVASENTQANVDRIRRELGLVENSTTHLLRDEYDYERVFLEAMSILRALEEEGFRRDQVDVDFTSGTKAMSAGLALAAVAFGCDQLRYIAVERIDGVVVSGTERYIARSPTRVRAYFDLQAAVRLFESLQFEAARKLLGEINPGLLDEYGRRLHTSLTVLVDAYDAWDKFDHAGFKDRYRKPDADLRELASFVVEDKVRGLIGQMASASSRGPSKCRKTTTTPDYLADLWNNAHRRMSEGKLDDAVARLYRLTEMIAQYVLDSRYGIDTSNVDIAALPAALSERNRQWLEAMAVGTDDQGKPIKSTVKLGLRDSYRLLAGLGDALGPLVPPFGAKPSRLTQLLDTRNASILAHGVTPISADDTRDLSDEVRKLAVLAVPDFDARCAQLQFPWLAAGA